MLRNISIMALAVVAMAGCATADKKMNDLEIAHSAYTAGNLDIRYAHMAPALSETECVRRFAETMIRDHSAVNDQAVALITKLKVTPQDNPLSQTLVKGASEKRNELSALRGKASTAPMRKTSSAIIRSSTRPSLTSSSPIPPCRN